jgi:hypothetical protein
MSRADVGYVGPLNPEPDPHLDEAVIVVCSSLASRVELLALLRPVVEMDVPVDQDLGLKARMN